MTEGTILEQLQKMIFDAKINYMQGNDVYVGLEKMEQLIITHMKENDSLGKMSKTDKEF